MSSDDRATVPDTVIAAEVRPKWGNLVAGTLALTADGFDLAIMAYLLPYVEQTFGISLGVASILLLATTSTRWIGGLLFGSLASRFGRKPILIASVAVVGLLTIASGLAPGFVALLIIRLVFGLGVGGVYATAAPLIREGAGTRGGLFSGIMIFGWFGGGAISPLFYYLFVPTWGWRGAFIAEGVILLLIPYLVFAVHESDVWLASKNRVVAVADGIRELGRDAAGQLKGRSFWHLFAPTFLGTTVMLVCLEYGNFFAQSSGTLFPTFLKEQHLSVGVIALIGSISSFAGMPGSLLGGWLCDRLGRRHTFMLIFGLIWIPVVITFTIPTIPLLFFSWGVFGLMNGALGGSLAVFETEAYPTDLRAPGYGFAHNLGALGGSFGVTIAAFLSAHISLPVALIAMTFLGVFLGLLAMRFAKETAGKSLITDEVIDPEQALRAQRATAGRVG
jgi:SHS family lactate transporter-like MFS transporter